MDSWFLYSYMLIAVQITPVTRFDRYRGKLIECNSRYRMLTRAHILNAFFNCTYNYLIRDVIDGYRDHLIIGNSNI